MEKLGRNQRIMFSLLFVIIVIVAVFSVQSLGQNVQANGGELKPGDVVEDYLDGSNVLENHDVYLVDLEKGKTYAFQIQAFDDDDFDIYLLTENYSNLPPDPDISTRINEELEEYLIAYSNQTTDSSTVDRIVWEADNSGDYYICPIAKEGEKGKYELKFDITGEMLPIIIIGTILVVLFLVLLLYLNRGKKKFLQKYCIKCGAELLEGSNFCIKCGEKILER
ncbi:MAG: zinc ribbon domain-containing protein [Asgard group archaeon]